MYKVSTMVSTFINVMLINTQLTDEEPPEVSVIGALKGGQSLKRVKLCENAHADPCVFLSTYHVLGDDVNWFCFNVKPHPQ